MEQWGYLGNRHDKSEQLYFSSHSECQSYAQHPRESFPQRKQYRLDITPVGVADHGIQFFVIEMVFYGPADKQRTCSIFLFYRPGRILLTALLDICVLHIDPLFTAIIVFIGNQYSYKIKKTTIKRKKNICYF